MIQEYTVQDEQGQQIQCVRMEDMISVVEMFLLVHTRRRIKISPPANDRQLQLLGKAYDKAVKDPITMWQF